MKDDQSLSLVEALKLFPDFESTFLVVSVQGDNATRLRISELGLGPGTELKIKGQLPFKGPIIVDLESNSIALRSQEAECLQVIQTN